MSAQGEAIIGEDFEHFLVVKHPQAQRLIAIFRLEQGEFTVLSELADGLIWIGIMPAHQDPRIARLVYDLSRA